MAAEAVSCGSSAWLTPDIPLTVPSTMRPATCVQIFFENPGTLILTCIMLRLRKINTVYVSTNYKAERFKNCRPGDSRNADERSGSMHSICKPFVCAHD